MTTLEDIAQAIGTTKSTVSKALNGAEDVSEFMRQTVLEKAVELGYNRRIRTKSVPTIAIFITNMEYKRPGDFGYDLILGFRKAAEPAGYNVTIVPLTIELQQHSSYDTYMLQQNFLGGFFLGLSFIDPWLQQFETCKTPTVLYDNHVSENPFVSHLGVDNTEGMNIAVNYIRSLGHEKIGYLSHALDSYVYRQRHQAFFQALESNHLTPDPNLAGSAFHISDCLSEHLPRLLEMGCTAILCSHDILASSALIYCTELGLSIPKDISIVGFDDISLCQHTSPPLSTIRQDRESLGKSAFYAFTSQFNHVAISTLLLHPKLVIRSSCAPYSSNDS